MYVRCDRCDGTGVYSPTSLDNGRCWGCGATGQRGVLEAVEDLPDSDHVENFMHEQGIEASKLLNQLRLREPECYTKAVASIVAGRSVEVSRYLQKWWAETRAA
jgi:hypothetical protein